MRRCWLLGAGLVLAACDGGGREVAARLAEQERRLAELEARSARAEAPTVAPAPSASVTAPAPTAAEPDPALWKELADALAGPEAEAKAKVQALLARGLDPLGAGPEGERALVLAARARKVDVLRLLLEEARVPVDQREEERGETALMAAVTAPIDAAAVDLLLRAGADPTLVSGPWDPPREQLESAHTLALAAEADPELIERLAEARIARQADRGGITALDRVVLIPPPGGLREPVEVVLGRSDGDWGGLVLVVHRDVVLEEGTSLIETRHGVQLIRMGLRWRQGERSGRRDLVFNKPNAGEIGEHSAMGAVSELSLPEGLLRIELELRPVVID